MVAFLVLLGCLQSSNQRPADRGVPVEPAEREPGGHEALVLQGRLQHEAARKRPRHPGGRRISRRRQYPGKTCLLKGAQDFFSAITDSFVMKGYFLKITYPYITLTFEFCRH